MDFIDLDSSNIGIKINEKWIGKSLKDIIKGVQIEKIIITKSLSSAPLEMHARTIRRFFSLNVKVENRPEASLLEPWFEAVLVLSDKRYLKFQLFSPADSDGSWGRLSGTEGGAYFRNRTGF